MIVSDQLTETYESWIDGVLSRDGHVRDGKWSGSVAVGTKSFVEKIKKKLGIRAMGREVVRREAGYELKEHMSPYRRNSDPKMGALRAENSYSWHVFDDNSA